MSGLSGIHTHWLHLEKPEICRWGHTLWWVWSHGGMFQCLRSSVQRRKHGSVKIHTVHHCFLLRSHLNTWHFCGHLDCTFTLLPPTLMFAFAPVFGRVASSQLVLVWHFYLYCTVSSTCHKSVVYRKTALFSPQFWSQKAKLLQTPLFPTRPQHRHWDHRGSETIF